MIVQKEDMTMSTFEERGESLEAKAAYDQEVQFKNIARRNYRLGLWAAELLGKEGAEAEEYAHLVIKSDFEEPGEEDVVRKVTADLESTDTSESDVRSKMESLLAEVTEENKG